MVGTGRLSGTTAIVTGASAGIGEAIVKTFAREGASVVIASRNLPKAQHVRDEITAAGGSALAFLADVTRPKDVDALVQATLEQFGTIDILVNGVGGWEHVTPVFDIRDEEWDRIIALNLKSAFLCVRAVARVMMNNKSGRIINIASQAGTGPNSVGNSILPYACGKAGVIALTKHLAKQLGPYGITVNTISPGTTVTPHVLSVWDSETSGVAGFALNARQIAVSALARLCRLCEFCVEFYWHRGRSRYHRRPH